VARRFYAKRYSQAVFAIALERNELDRWQSDLRKIATLAGDASFIALLENPKVYFEVKARLLSQWLGEVNPVALNLVYLLVTRGRLSLVGDIADEYQRLLDSHRGIEQAEVTTAVELDDEDRQRLEQFLGAVVGKKVVVKPKVDSGVVGGIIARIGGKLLDGSTHSKLIALKNVLASGEIR
jgi:F-type H+-transporting ATPase subunit delta